MIDEESRSERNKTRDSSKARTPRGILFHSLGITCRVESGCEVVPMVQPAELRQRDNLATCLFPYGSLSARRRLLP